METVRKLIFYHLKDFEKYETKEERKSALQRFVSEITEYAKTTDIIIYILDGRLIDLFSMREHKNIDGFLAYDPNNPNDIVFFLLSKDWEILFKSGFDTNTYDWIKDMTTEVLLDPEDRCSIKKTISTLVLSALTLDNKNLKEEMLYKSIESNRFWTSIEEIVDLLCTHVDLEKEEILTNLKNQLMDALFREI